MDDTEGREQSSQSPLGIFAASPHSLYHEISSTIPPPCSSTLCRFYPPPKPSVLTSPLKTIGGNNNFSILLRSVFSLFLATEFGPDSANDHSVWFVFSGANEDDVRARSAS
ncbi:hypothetical protein PIB30_020001 [Stylosanthes scabra]|uniref:Uncharacterized protein n=1 Tax=Stylosanthes scabra TaxID=79078 RepID=A0ABU6Q8D3_9FABA|nr:hypothetical protein [Stylosanthes scabra]